MPDAEFLVSMLISGPYDRLCQSKEWGLVMKDRASLRFALAYSP